VEPIEFLDYKDRAGVSRTGLEEANEELSIKYLVNEASCYAEFTSLSNIYGAKWAYILSDHKDLTAEDAEHIQATLKQFEEDDCSAWGV
ncbi:hypothetical protein RRG08_049697, partial [Elysia crispata]